MQMAENVHLTSCKHKSHLLNFFLALSRKSARYSFPAHNGWKWEAVNQKTGITKLLFEGQVTAFPSTLGACRWLSWAALPQWHFSCKPKHAAEGCPQDSECAYVPACPGLHHHSKSQRLLQCKFACPHKAAWEFLPADVQKAPTCASLTVKSCSRYLCQGIWSPLGAGTFLHARPCQPRHTTELSQKPTCSSSSHKSCRWDYLNYKHFSLNEFYTQFSRLDLLIYFLR